MSNLDVLTLTGWHLDYHTGVAMGYEMLISNDGAGPAYRADNTTMVYAPTCCADHLLPVLQRMATVLQNKQWQARAVGSEAFCDGPTIGAAVCRALVRHVLGHTVPAVGAADETDCGDLFA